MKDKFSLAKFLQEEMKARDWTDADIESRVTNTADRRAAFLAIHSEDLAFILDDHTATVLSRVFDVDYQFFINLNR